MVRKNVVRVVAGIIAIVLVMNVPFSVYAAEVGQWVTDQDTGVIYRTDQEGNRITGSQWIIVDGRQYRINVEGKLYRDVWLSFAGGKTYHIDSTGAVQIGWFTSEGNTYYTDSNGVLQNGWFSVSAKKYYADRYGAVYKDRWFEIGGKKYHAGSTGIILTNSWITEGNNTYHTDTAGALQKGWFSLGSRKYYTNSDGAIYKNTWFEYDGKKYHTDKNGVVQKNCWLTIGGRKYRLGSNGVLYQSKTFTVSKKKYTANTYGIVSVKLNVPMVLQMPELPTGCEITSVTQILLYAGAKVNKMQLVKEMPKAKKDPNKGFVGSPYKTSGYTIFPKALLGLVKKYAGSAKDMTGCSFNTLQLQLSQGKPIAVWIGNIGGWFLHCVVLTGYDDHYFYYNDCYSGKKNVRMSKADFKKKWKKYGDKALSY